MKAWNEEGEVDFSAWDRVALEGETIRSGGVDDEWLRRREKSEDLLRGLSDAELNAEGGSRARTCVDMSA